MQPGSKLGWLGAAGVAVLAVTAINLLLQASPARAEARTPSNEESPAQVAQMYRELSLMRAELAGVKERVYQPPATASSLPVIDAQPVSEKIPPPKPVTLEALHNHFQQVFEGETADASWARAEEATIGEFIQHEGGEGSSLEALSCRRSMCRMQVRFRDDATRDAFKLKLGTPPLSNGGFYQEQGETELLYFAARAGYPLPPLPNE